VGLLKKLSSLVKSPRQDRNYWYYVKCDSCKEILKGRIDLFNQLSIQYDSGKKGSNYFCRKVLVGSNRCYRPIEVELTFDSNRKVIDRQINGGKFVTEEAFLAAYSDSA
jgi:hypothetical protein